MTQRFTSEAEAIPYIFQSLRKLRGVERGPDELTRDTTPTRRLLAELNLLGTPREYGVVTGSKGKGSTTALTARVLTAIGHRTGMISSPHLISWRERIRIDGRAIPEADFCRILSRLAPSIDALEALLNANQYFSPQGIFLAIALAWWDEQGADAAVLEVGRGGRFDDIAVVPNRLSLFTPIMLEHTAHLGPTLERIAWHKAGIIKQSSFAYSVVQAPEVLQVLQTEADRLDTEFYWFTAQDMAQFVGPTPNGMRVSLGRYGTFDVPMLGRYQLGNITLAVQGAGNMHARLPGISHGSPEYVARVRHGLETVFWPGRLQQVAEAPAIYVDGAINAETAQSLVASLEGRLSDPIIAIIGVPTDKDAESVYRELGLLADSVIVTETTRNVALHFAPPEDAVAQARRFNPQTSFAPDVTAALTEARRLAGAGGSIVVAGTQSIVADTVQAFGLNFEQI
jgi:dihydrofolate synthase/folylpolyglutamate synthase